jgi:hypothetical protein
MYAAVCRNCRRLTYFVHGRKKPKAGDSLKDYRLTSLSGRTVSLFTPVDIPICRHCEKLLRICDVDYVNPSEIGMRNNGSATYQSLRAQNGRLLEAAGRLLTFVQNVRDTGETSPRLEAQARWILNVVGAEERRHEEQFEAFHEDEAAAQKIASEHREEGDGDGEAGPEGEVEGKGLGGDPVGPDRTDPPIDHRENGSSSWYHPLA